MKRMFYSLLLAGLLVTSGCSSTKSATHQIEAPIVAAAEVSTAKLTNDVHWFRNSAEMRAVYLQGYKLAQDQLELEAKSQTPGTWAVSLDADETILDNSQYQKELILSGGTFSDETWNLWCERREAKALPGAKAFMERVKELGGKIVIVSNRYEESRTATEDNFKALGLPYDLMMLRQGKPDKQKERRWSEVIGGTSPAGWAPTMIVMYLGDNIEDFPDMDQAIRAQGDEAFAQIGRSRIMFPNPMYGSWPGNPQD